MDIGASWIHGIGPGAQSDRSWDGKLNPVYQHALDFKIKTVKCQSQEEIKQILSWWKGSDIPIDIWQKLEQIETFATENETLFSTQKSIAEVVKAQFPCEKGSEQEKI